MTLHLRLTISLVAVIATVVTVSGFLAVNSAERELIDGVDSFLIDRAEDLQESISVELLLPSICHKYRN